MEPKNALMLSGALYQIWGGLQWVLEQIWNTVIVRQRI